MSLNISKALRVYDRQDTVKVECADGWLVEIKPFSSAIKQLTKVQAALRPQGVSGNKRQVSSTSMSLVNPGLAAMVDENPWLLGSREADVKFFIDNVLVGWEGLTDDSGLGIIYTSEIAMQVFLENGEAGIQLYRDLLAASLDTKLFIKPLEQQAEEDSKN